MKMILSTERLILREMEDEDFDALKKVISDPENMTFYPKPYDDEGVLNGVLGKLGKTKLISLLSEPLDKSCRRSIECQCLIHFRNESTVDIKVLLHAAFDPEIMRL